MLRLFSEILKVVVWNPLTLKAINTVEFAAAALNADVVILPGTGLRAPADTDHTKWSINNKYWIVSFGRRRAPHTISSAGCAIVVRVLTPPKNQTFQGPLEKQAVQMAQSAQKHCEASGTVPWSCAVRNSVPRDFQLAVAQSLRARGVAVSETKYPCQKLVPTRETSVKAAGQ